MTYTNQLVYPESSTPFPLIVHGNRWRVDVNCNLDRYEHVTQQYKPTVAHPTQTTIHHQVGGSGHYDIDLQFFTDPQYFHEIPVRYTCFFNILISHAGLSFVDSILHHCKYRNILQKKLQLSDMGFFLIE